MVTHPRPFLVADRTTYTLSSGGTVTETAWRKLCPSLEPVRDGLFQDGPSQTFKLRTAEA